MADSVGGPGFPSTGIQKGHLHFDAINNILYIWNGGNPADSNNWSEVGGSGVAGGILGTQRYTFMLAGDELIDTFARFIMPAAGTITKWGLVAVLAEAAIMELIFDPFNANITVDTQSLAAATVIRESSVSQAVIAGNIIAINQTEAVTDPTNSVCGYIDFTPD